MPLEDVEMTVTDSKLLGLDLGSPLEDDDNLLSKEDDEAMAEDADIDCPDMRVSTQEKSCLRKPWRRTLIIRLLDRKLKTIWTTVASFELITLDNGFFLVRFSSLDDYNHAKFFGPWLIFYRYLIVRPCQPNFDPLQDSLRSLLC